MDLSSPQAPVNIVGRYALFGEIASGGMATIHLGRLLGPAGFSRTVAIKRLHPQFAKDPEFVTMFLDEARLAARIRHPNVISPLDIVATHGELFLVMDYVQGDSLTKLCRATANAGKQIPIPITRAIGSGLLHGLHAAHEATDERGEPLGIVHRDVSPQNVLVGVDGVARVLDFGIAKAAGRASTTRQGEFKGKLAYMAPESFHGAAATRKVDVYATGIVLWEVLTGQRLFRGEDDATTVARILTAEVRRPSSIVPGISPELDGVVLRALERDPTKRFGTAREMALALEASGPVARPAEVGEWVGKTVADLLEQRAVQILEVEQASEKVLRHVSTLPPPQPPSTALDDSNSGIQAPVTLQGQRAFAGIPARVLRSRIAIAGGLSLLVLVIAGSAFVSNRRGPAASAAPVAGQSNQPGPERQAPGPLDTSIAAAPAPNSMPDGAPASVAAPLVLPPATPRARPLVASPKPAPNKAAGRSECDPPYVLDGAGHRRYKLECL